MSDTETPGERTEETTSWPELATGPYGRLTERGVETVSQFEDTQVAVPSKTGKDTEHAHRERDGTLRATTERE